MRTYTDLRRTFPDQHDWHLGHVLRHYAARTPDKIYLDAADEARTFSYATMLEHAEAFASGLHTAGARAGDRVLIMAFNSSELVRSWFGAALGGLVEVPLNTSYEHEFLAHQVRTVVPRWAVIDDIFADRFVAIAGDAEVIETFWVIDTGHLAAALTTLRSAGWAAHPWESLLATVPVSLAAPRMQDLASIFFTSGTTGPSKGVAMPHSQMYYFAESVVSLARLTAADIYLSTTPLFHGNAQFMAAYPALIAGGTFAMRRKFSASRWVDHLRHSGVTVTNFVGPMMDFVFKQAPRDDDAENSLRCVFAAPTASAIVRDFEKRFGIEAFVEVFGLTETSPPIMSPYGEQRPAGAAGLLVSDYFEVRLVDPDTDEEVPVGEVGELTIRTKVPWTCSMGYYNMPEKTVEAWRNLWFHTGDALRRDHDGWYYFVDRYKDALRRRGENISSYEVEQGILSHPSVLEVAVIAVTDGITSTENEVMACIVGQAGANPDEIWKHCTGTLPDFAIPRFLRFMPELPKTPSEKIRKAALREQAVTPDTFDRTAVTQAS
jgi:carnitine-CoA ligase